MKSTILTISFALALGSTFGCSTTVRSMTATKWIAPPQAASAEPAPPVETEDEEPVVGIASQYYLSYWEGSCSRFTGCSRGTSAVKRCRVATDNATTCTDEAHLNQILNPD